jgi:hypothetical protein
MAVGEGGGEGWVPEVVDSEKKGIIRNRNELEKSLVYEI